MHDFLLVPKKIPSIKEIEEMKFENFMEELKKEKIANAEGKIKFQISEEEKLEREKYCKELYEEISEEINSLEKITFDKNVRYIEQLKKINNEFIFNADKPQTLDENIFGNNIEKKKIEKREKVMNFVGDYIYKIKFNLEK